MTSKAFTAGWLVAAALLSSWAISSASDQARADRRGFGGAAEALRAEAEGRAYDLPPLSAEVDAQISRLATRTYEMASASPHARNPFTFEPHGTSELPNRARDTRAMESAPALVVDTAGIPAPAPALSGIADTGAGALTAVISLRDDLHFVKKGDVIAGRYRVDAVTVDGVDIFDLTLGTILRLTLQGVT